MDWIQSIQTHYTLSIFHAFLNVFGSEQIIVLIDKNRLNNLPIIILKLMYQCHCKIWIRNSSAIKTDIEKKKPPISLYSVCFWTVPIKEERLSLTGETYLDVSAWQPTSTRNTITLWSTRNESIETIIKKSWKKLTNSCKKKSKMSINRNGESFAKHTMQNMKHFYV